MNYATLFETIKGYIENDFPDTSWTNSAGTGTVTLTSTEQVNTFIQQAEQKIYNTVQLPALRKNVTGAATSGNKYLGIPSDWLATFSLAAVNPTTGEYTYLLNKDVNYIREAFPFPATSGAPTHYAIFSPTAFLLGPTPNASYAMELHYFYIPESIVTAGTTWLGNNFDTVLLYGSLVEANMFIKGEADMTATYQKQFDEALAKLKVLSDGKDRQDAYRSGQARIQVM
jgi:hypothetical protein